MGIRISIKKLILLLAVVLGLLALLFFITLAITSNQKTIGTFGGYFNGYKFKLKPASGWQVVSSNSDKTSVSFQKGSSTMIVNIKVNKVLNEVSPPEVYANQFIETQAQLPGFETVSLEKFRFKDSLPGTRTVYKLDGRQGVRVDLVTNLEYFDIKLETTESNFAAEQSEFNQMLDTLIIVVPAE